MTVSIITDSTVDIFGKLPEGVEVIPANITFGEKTYLDTEETRKILFPRIFSDGSRIIPKTAAPGEDPIGTIFGKCLARGDSAFVVSVTSKKSRFFESFREAAREFPEGKIRIIDSRTTSGAMFYLVSAAAEMARKGANLDQIEREILALIPRTRAFVILNTLDFVVAGGRISNVLGVAGSLLNIKPVLKVVDGDLSLIGRPRGENKGIEKLVDLFNAEGKMKKVGVLYVNKTEGAQRVIEMLRKKYPEVEEGQTGISLASHTGPGAIGIMGLLQ